MSDLVSVIVPTYNSQSYIEETLRSVCEQTYTELEIIIVDDCSTDNTVSIVQSINDPRFILIRQKINGGAGAARNAGVEIATGRYIAFLDSDDLWLPAKTETQIEFMKNNKVASCYALYSLIDECGINFGTCGEISTSLTYKQLLPHNPIRTSSFIYNAHELGKIYFPLIRKRQDFGLFLIATKRAGKSHLFPEVTCSYRIRPDSISGKKLKNIPFQWRFYREHLSMGKLNASRYIFEWFFRAGLIEIKRKILKSQKIRK